jgi:hypothetical protein
MPITLAQFKQTSESIAGRAAEEAFEKRLAYLIEAIDYRMLEKAKTFPPGDKIKLDLSYVTHPKGNWHRNLITEELIKEFNMEDSKLKRRLLVAYSDWNIQADYRQSYEYTGYDGPEGASLVEHKTFLFTPKVQTSIKK